MARARGRAGTEATEINSPRVGRFRPAITTGALLAGGQRLGDFEILGEHMDLLLPEGIAGEVTEILLADKVENVEYGQPLILLAPLRMDGSGSATGDGVKDKGATSKGREVKAPTAGVFYRRATPGAPAYVEVGSRIKIGQTIGLVEIMKCFNPVRYEGAGLPGEATVLEIRAEDSSEVVLDQVLFVVE